MLLKETLKEFSSYYKACLLVDTPIEPTRADTLRVSGFPHCGLKHVYTRMIQPTEYESFSSGYYTGVGTLTHELVQEFLGRSGRMYGNWKCIQEGCYGGRTFSSNNKCPACGYPMPYEEIDLDYKLIKKMFPHLSSGHIDGVYRNSAGEYFIVDYKTTNSVTASLSDKDTYLPYPSNKAQINGYAALIELRFNIKIKGWILFYIARDKPTFTYKATGGLVTEADKAKTLKKIKTYSDNYGLVMNCTSYDTVEYLRKTKPCKCLADYNEEFSAFGGCLLVSICFEPKMLKHELKRAWDVKEDNFLEWKRPATLALPKL